MKHILKIDYTTYILLVLSLFCGNFKRIIILFVIIIIHELGHLIWLKKYHKKIIKITIYPFGGISKYQSLINHNLKEEFLIAMGGILNQILLLIPFYFLKKYMLINDYTYHLFITYNYYLIIFNVLPIIPLDGSKALNILLELIWPYHLANRYLIIISFISLIFFILYSFTFKVNILIIISFLIYELILFIKNCKYLEDKMVLEHFLYDIPYHKIRYFKEYNKHLFYQNTFHYFNYVPEKVILNKIYK